VFETEIPRSASRLPGPTNGAMDLSEKDRWIITGSPFIQVRFKDTGLDLEARLRKIILRAIPKVGPELATQLIAMLKDPLTIILFAAGIAAWLQAHFAIGPVAAVALLLDVVSLAVLTMALGQMTLPFLQAMLVFLEMVADAQTNEELEAGAEAFASMLVMLGLAIPAVIGLKRTFSALKTKASTMAKRPASDVALKPRKVKPLKQIGPPLPPAAPGTIARAHIKVAKVVEGLKKAWRESFPDDPFARREQGGYIVENPDGTLDFERWPNEGIANEIQPPPVEGPAGKGEAFFKGRRVRGSGHVHPNPKVNEFGETAHTEPSQGDGAFAKKFATDTGVAGENYVISADGKVYVFNEGGFEVVGSRLSIIGE
jgi:hypothetical protein